VVTSRTQAQDLLWSFDHVRRLADAQAQELRPVDTYVEPGVLWKAFAPDSARKYKARRDAGTLWGSGPDEGNPPRRESVVLIDEIDKADPDLPNGLLVPLGSRRFVVSQAKEPVEPEPDTQVLVVITTNEQRELPEAFLRRCLVVALKHPDKTELVTIARKHVAAYDGAFTRSDQSLAEELAATLEDLRATAGRKAHRKPSTAEFLDAFHACRRLGIMVGGEQWDELSRMALIKQDNVQ
jgi:MoxR-like ATPase